MELIILISVVAYIIFFIWFVASLSKIKSYQKTQTNLLMGIANKMNVEDDYFPSKYERKSLFLVPETEGGEEAKKEDEKTSFPIPGSPLG